MKGFSSRLAHGTRSTTCAICLGIAGLIGHYNAQAVIGNLSDGNSTISIDLSSQAGMTAWNVNGVDHVVQEWFWFRIGNTAEASIDTISAPSISQPLARQLTVTYDIPAQYGVTVRYNLTGSSNPGLTEAITIANHGASPLDFHFFRYGQISLAGNTLNQSASFGTDISGVTSVNQTGNGRAFQSALTSSANHAEAALFSTTLTKLNDGAATLLNDNLAVGPANNVTWAFQWDFTIAAGASQQISILNSIVPEPSVFALSGLAMAGFLHFRRKKAK